MDYLMMMLEKYSFLEKDKSIFYPRHRSNWIQNTFRIIGLPKIFTKA